jgi:PPK2 family polyphosphate:nucleotide phosphotransferase
VQVRKSKIPFMKDIVREVIHKETNEIHFSRLDSKNNLGFASKTEGKKVLEQNRIAIEKESEKLFANKTHGLLFVIQAMDAAKKDSTIKHVFHSVQPQLISIAEFKEPTGEELKHDYLWRISKKLPERGQIGIFNRSHYEEVIVTRVHPEFIVEQKIPGITKPENVDDAFWNKRYRQINNFEKHLHENGYTIIKIFLHMSKEKQRQRFLRRINRPDKHWKFEYKDIEERRHWFKYQEAYEQALKHTSTDYAPWHIIPADRKWVIRAAVSTIVLKYLKDLKLEYPVLNEEKKQQLQKAKEMLLKEK